MGRKLTNHSNSRKHMLKMIPSSATMAYAPRQTRRAPHSSALGHPLRRDVWGRIRNIWLCITRKDDARIRSAWLDAGGEGEVQ